MTNPNVNQLDPVIQEQLDKINKEGNRGKPEELWLETNSKQYLDFYTDGISKNELARRIIDQRNRKDSKDNKDYFNDTNKDQIKKANSYAEYILGDQVSILEKEQKEHTKEIAEETVEADKEKNEQVDELKNKLNGEDTKPKEEIKESSETQVETMKERLWKTIEKYIEKIKQLKNSNEKEKKKMNTEMDKLQKTIKEERDSYKKAQKDFFTGVGQNYREFNKKELQKLPTRLLRYEQREWLFNKPIWFNSISAIRRRRTINTLAKKFNHIWKDHKNGVRFIMGFEKDRLLRYTGIRINSALDKLGWSIGLKMKPEEFHDMFNAWKKAMIEVLENKNAGELSPDETIKVNAIKTRINYYWAMYAKERANSRVGPFIDAEKNATKEAKIFQPQQLDLAA